MNDKRKRGNIGEDFAVKFLAKKGFEIVDRNFRTRFGEIDIIAKDKEYILFIEVKARGENMLFSPAEAVIKSKQRKIILTAQIYLSQNPVELQPRFDIIEVYLERDKPKKAIMIENAFC